MTPTTMQISIRYGTHLPVLLAAVARTTGSVLELGVGSFSTPVLHWLCRPARRLVSCETDPKYYHWAAGYRSNWHEVLCLESWDAAPVDQPWDVVLVDHSPPERRAVEINRLAGQARFIIAHDSNGRYDRFYHYSTVFPSFKYRWTFAEVEPSTTVLSNFEPVEGFV